MQLVLDTKGLVLGRKAGVFLVETEKAKKSISPGKLSSIAVTANITLSTDAIMLAVEREIPIYFLDWFGKVKGRLWSPHFSTISTLRRYQVQFADLPEATAWMIDLFELKAENQVAVLQFLRKQNSGVGIGLSTTANQIKRNARSFDKYRGMLLDKARQPIMGSEGAIARIYWQAIGQSLPRTFRFTERSRRPAKDPFNAALNYMYGMLYATIESAIFAAGLDPQLGFLHVDAYSKPTLSYDLIEPFRPWVDQLLIKMCLEKKVEKNHFSKNQYGLFLNKLGKKEIIPAFNDFLRSERFWLKQNSTVNNHIQFTAGKLAQRIRTTLATGA